jgi:hypothetical protein
MEIASSGAPSEHRANAKELRIVKFVAQNAKIAIVDHWEDRLAERGRNTSWTRRAFSVEALSAAEWHDAVAVLAPV